MLAGALAASCTDSFSRGDVCIRLFGSYTVISREACQVRKKAALNGSGHACKSSLKGDCKCTDFNFYTGSEPCALRGFFVSGG